MRVIYLRFVTALSSSIGEKMKQFRRRYSGPICNRYERMSVWRIAASKRCIVRTPNSHTFAVVALIRNRKGLYTWIVNDKVTGQEAAGETPHLHWSIAEANKVIFGKYIRDIGDARITANRILRELGLYKVEIA